MSYSAGQKGQLYPFVRAGGRAHAERAVRPRARLLDLHRAAGDRVRGGGGRGAGVAGELDR
jgi:hypothetical protein